MRILYLDLDTLRDYLGPTAIVALAEQGVGAWSEPIEAADGFRLVRVLEREAQTAPPLAEVEPLVRQDLVRHRGDDALRRYLDSLRDETRIERNETIFAPGPPAAPQP